MEILYTLGYSGIPVLRLFNAVRNQGVLVADVRLVARSRLPEWNRARLQEILGEHYIHVPSLGNRNYKTSGPIVIDRPDQGIPKIVGLLQTQPVMLLCACKNLQTCHRTVVANMIHEASGCTVQDLTILDINRWAGLPSQPSLF